MANRYEYFLDLSASDQSGVSTATGDLELRAALPTDTHSLAELMIEAYRGTIDYDGETLEDAIGEIEAYMAGKRGGQPLLADSRLAFVGARLVGACLAGDWQERNVPLIAYIMTSAEWKNRGVGRQVLGAVLHTLYEQGHQQVRAVITEGNLPSERLLGRIGFQRTSIT